MAGVKARQIIKTKTRLSLKGEKMDKKKAFEELVKEIKGLKTDDMYLNDFFLTWEKSDDELKAVWDVADALQKLKRREISLRRFFDSGLGISLFRDNSTRTRFSFASACNLLGLEASGLG